MGRFETIQTPTPEAESLARREDAPLDAGHFLEQAERAMSLGRWESALRAYGRALERDRKSEVAWAGQVEALIEMGQPAEAMTWTEQAAKVVGESPQILALRAVCCARTGKNEDALAWSDRAMRASRDDREVWLARAEVMFSSGQQEPATRALEKACERTPSPDTRRRCGAIALFYGEIRLAQLHLERARRELPDDPVLALHLGVLRERQGDLVAARAELDRALAIEPGMQAARLAIEDIDSRTPVQRLYSKVRRWWND